MMKILFLWRRVTVRVYPALPPASFFSPLQSTKYTSFNPCPPVSEFTLALPQSLWDQLGIWRLRPFSISRSLIPNPFPVSPPTNPLFCPFIGWEHVQAHAVPRPLPLAVNPSLTFLFSQILLGFQNPLKFLLSR